MKFKKKNNLDQISVISVNFNGERWMTGYLESLKRQKKVNLEVILIDNNSTDDSLKLAKKIYPEIRIVKNKTNTGFGIANNQGADLAKGNILFFLNTDIEIPNENTISIMIKTLKNKKYSILGPQIIGFDDLKVTGKKKLGVDIFSYPGLSNHSFYIDGCALMIPKKDFFEIGKFDEKYFMYGEDIDLSWRARLLKKKIGIENKSVIKHYGGGSSTPTHSNEKSKHRVPEFRRYEVEKNSLRNILKNFGFVSLLLVIPAFIFLSLSESLVYLLSGERKASGKIFEALRWNIKNIDSTLKKRKEIQDSRKVSDRHIVKLMTFFPNKIITFIHIGIPKFIS